MCYAEPPAILIGFSEKNIGGTRHQLFGHPLDALKPCEFHFSGLILNIGHQPFFPGHPDRLHLSDPTNDLHMLQVTIDLIDLVEFGAVLVAKWIMLKELTKGKNVQLLIDQCCFLWAYSLQKLNFGIKESRQFPAFLVVKSNSATN